MARTAASVAEAHGSSSPSYRRAAALDDALSASPPRPQPPARPRHGADSESESMASGSEEDEDDDENYSVVESHSAAAPTVDATAPAGVASGHVDLDEKFAMESFPDRFASWEALDEYIQEFKASAYQLFRLRTSVPVTNRNRRLAKRDSTSRAHSDYKALPEEWVFYSRIYACTHGAVPRRRGKGLRNHQSVRDTGCTARMNATLKCDRATKVHYISVRLDGWHNHPCDRERFYAYPENRRIKDPALLRKVLQLHERGKTAREIQIYIAKIMVEMTGEEGGVPTKADIQNMIVRLKAAKRNANAADSGGGNACQRNPESEVEKPEESIEDEDEGAAENPSISDTERSRRKKRRADELAGESEELEVSTSRQTAPPVKISRLAALLDTPYCYQQAHEQIERVEMVHAEGIPRTISGFKHEIVQLSPSDKPEDLDFILPQYVLYGCENAVIMYCKYHGLFPSSVGVTLPVQKRGVPATATLTVVISSRQLRAMKQVHLARQTTREVKKVTNWIRTATFRTCPPPPFDDHFHSSKDTFLTSLKLMPLTKTVVCGTSVDGGAPVGFTDTVIGAHLLNFGCSTNIDVDCVKAILLHMHARFNATASFVCPSFMFEADERERRRRANAYGAFASQKECVLGAAQLRSSRWGSFFLRVSTQQCFVYAPNDTEFAEMKVALTSLFRGCIANVVFVFSPIPAAATEATDSGILSLLFLECMLLNKKWMDIPMDSLDYFRVRYLMQAIQVVSKQDVHDIQWL